MPCYKLYYFDIRARAEISRLLFAAAGVKYEDIRVDGAKWAQLKPNSPFGQMPILEVDGVKLCQSKTIARYLAGQFGLAGKTDLDRARADMLVDCGADVLEPSIKFFFEKDKAKQAELATKFKEETLPKSFELFEKLLKENKGGDSFLVGDSLTWADIAFIDLLGWLGALEVELPFDKAPKLKALRERVEAIPKIAEWIKTRPKTNL